MGKRANGEGTISKRMKDGKCIGYRGNVPVGTRPDGKPDLRWASAKTEKALVLKLREIKSNLHLGLIADTEGLTVKQYLDRWLEYKARDARKANTLRSYSDTVRLYLAPTLGRLKLEKLRPLDVEHLVSHLLRSGKSPAMAAYALRILKMALRQAVYWGMLPRNVAEAVKPPRVPRKELEVWTPEEVLTFLGAAEAHRLYAGFYLALMTGLRRGELLGLHWTDVDLTRSRLTVRHNLVDVRGKTVLNAPKTENSCRTVILSPGTLAVLQAHRQRQAAEREAAGSAWTDRGFVFASTVGSWTEPRNFDRMFAGVVQRASVRRIRFHDLRHTAASLMIRKGVPAKTVSETLGHGDVAFTLRVYTHLYDDQREEAALDLSDLFPRAVGQH